MRLEDLQKASNLFDRVKQIDRVITMDNGNPLNFIQLAIDYIPNDAINDLYKETLAKLEAVRDELLKQIEQL